MKRILTILLLCLIVFSPAQAVLKEKDLARTLGVLRAELAANYEQQQQFMAMYEQQGAAQHQLLVNYMTQCEQIGLMLYSQNTQNTFDMAYACQQATQLYRNLHRKKAKTLPYDKIIANMKREIERYDNLIRTLKSMPPVASEDAGEVMTESDSILMGAIDSLAVKMDSLAEVAETTMVAKPMMPSALPDDEAANDEPLYLSGQQLKDRAVCLNYAQTMRDNLQKFLETMEAESGYYKSLQEKVQKLNKFAQSRYKVLQDNIFRNGESNYFTVLGNLPMYIMRARTTIQSKYKPFEGHDRGYSEWRGAYVMFISIFLILYLSLALGISYIILRWLLPRKWRGENFKLKRQMLNNVVGIGLFAIIVMIVRTQTDRNFIQMSTGLIINMAWLLEAIFLSLYIRLKGEQMRHASAIYTPLMLIAFIVILFRIILIPNLLVNLFYPPILLGFTIWQLRCSSKHATGLPVLDKAYTNITSVVMVVACLMAWAGYTLLSVQVMIWWTFQLAAIMTITCVYDLMEMFEYRYLVFRIRPDLKEKGKTKDVSKQVNETIEEMKMGHYFSKTWVYDLINRTLVPIFAVASVLFSIYWAGDIFEMTDIFLHAFMVNFIDQKDLIQISLSKLCMVAALWFIFRYINYSVRSIYRNYRKMTLKAGEQYNSTLARNIIAIICWGLYFITVLVLLHVPRSGISIVGAGLATGLGFAMQSILENFFYGISLMTGRLRVGDYIECDGVAGKVESISYQSTQIVTADGSVIAFLNSALFSKNFKNMTKNHRYELIKIPVGVAYGTDVEKVRQLILDAIAPVCQERNKDKKPLTKLSLPPSVAFADFGDNSVDLKVCVWMLVEEKLALTGRIKEVIYNTLKQNNIEIPFPQRDVHIIQH